MHLHELVKEFEARKAKILDASEMAEDEANAKIEVDQERIKQEIDARDKLQRERETCLK